MKKWVSNEKMLSNEKMSTRLMYPSTFLFEYLYSYLSTTNEYSSPTLETVRVAKCLLDEAM